MNNIQIFEIELKDYRQYKGVVPIDLETDEDLNINVIEGQNGAGKSNLLNAITLCFYDTEAHLESNRQQGLESDPYVNLKRLEEIGEGDTATGYVEVTLGRDRPQWVFRRTFTTGKLPGGGFENSTGDLQLDQRFGEDWEPMEQPNVRLSQILPNHVHEYFFFDGEQLDEFFEVGYTDRVQNAILDVSHIELLNRAIDHLGTVQSKYEDRAGDFEGEAQRRKAAYQEADEELNRLRSEYEQLERDIEDAQSSIEDINQKLSDSTDEEVREKQSQRHYLTKRLDDKESDLKTALADGGQALADAGIVAYNLDALEFTNNRFDEMEADGELPPKIQKWFVENLLERETCICGEPIDTEEKHKHLIQLRDEVADIDEGNIEGKIEIPHIIEESSEKVSDLLDEKARIEDVDDEISKIDTELDEISAFLSTKDVADDEDVGHWESQRSDIQDRIDRMNVRKGKLDSKIERQEEERDEKYEEWQEELEKEERHAEVLRKIKFVHAAQEQIQMIKTEILEQVRSETEACLEQYFNELIWKEEPYDIELTNDYQVNLSGPSGEKGLRSLSAGERQVLALSFMSALSQISGFSAPIVIDTPLGRISSKPKKRIAQNIPEYLKGTQVTFLMTDEEYSQDVRVFFKQNVAHEYHLDYHDEVTEVVPQ